MKTQKKIFNPNTTPHVRTWLACLLLLSSSVACELPLPGREDASSASEIGLQTQSEKLIQRQHTLQKAPFRGLENQNKIRLAPTLEISSLADSASIALRNKLEIRSVIHLDDENAVTLQVLSDLESELRELIPIFILKDRPIFESSRQDTVLSNLLVDELQARFVGLTRDQITRLGSQMLDALRDDHESVVVDFSYLSDSASQTQIQTNQILQSFLTRMGVGIKHRSTEVYGTKWEIYSHEYEAGNPDSGDYTAVSQYDEVKRGDHDADDNGFADWDNDGDFILDKDEVDGRGDGDGFWDSVMDALAGDDGDGITHESESGAMHLQNQMLEIENRYLDQMDSQISNMLMNTLAPSILQSPLNSTLMDLNQWTKTRYTQSFLRLRAVKITRPIRF